MKFKEIGPEKYPRFSICKIGYTQRDKSISCSNDKRKDEWLTESKKRTLKYTLSKCPKKSDAWKAGEVQVIYKR